MTEMRRFTLTLIAGLVVAWLLSGERFLDLAFEMMDLGQVDDIILSVLVVVEEGKADLGLPDVFGALRRGLHSVLGLG